MDRKATQHGACLAGLRFLSRARGYGVELFHFDSASAPLITGDMSHSVAFRHSTLDRTGMTFALQKMRSFFKKASKRF